MTSKYKSDNKREIPPVETERYATYSDGAGEVVVYDTQNDDAWLKCDSAVEISAMV